MIFWNTEHSKKKITKKKYIYIHTKIKAIIQCIKNTYLLMDYVQYTIKDTQFEKHLFLVCFLVYEVILIFSDRYYCYTNLLY